MGHWHMHGFLNTVRGHSNANSTSNLQIMTLKNECAKCLVKLKTLKVTVSTIKYSPNL